MMPLKPLLALAAAFAISTTAFAHAPKVGHNGGQQTDAGSYHLEVVAKGKQLTVFLRDHGDKPIATGGFRGTAIFTVNGKPVRINLVPAGENTLTGEAGVELPAQPKGAVQITPTSGSTVQGKF